MAQWLQIGAVMAKKSGKGVHIKVANDVSLKKGQYLQVFDPRKKTNKDGSPLTEEQLSKIPDYVRHEIFLVIE